MDSISKLPKNTQLIIKSIKSRHLELKRLIQETRATTSPFNQLVINGYKDILLKSNDFKTLPSEAELSLKEFKIPPKPLKFLERRKEISQHLSISLSEAEKRIKKSITTIEEFKKRVTELELAPPVNKMELEEWYSLYPGWADVVVEGVRQDNWDPNDNEFVKKQNFSIPYPKDAKRLLKDLEGEEDSLALFYYDEGETMV